MEKTHTSHFPQFTVLDRHIPSQYQDDPQINLMTFSGTSLYINTITCFHYIAQCELSIVILKTFFFFPHTAYVLNVTVFNQPTVFNVMGNLSVLLQNCPRKPLILIFPVQGVFPEKVLVSRKCSKTSLAELQL